MLLGHAPDELLDFLRHTGAAKLLAVLAAIKLLRDESPIPAHKGIGGHQGGDVFALLAAQGIGQGRKAAALGVGAAPASLTELGFEKMIFLKEIGDDVFLVACDPAGEHGDEDVQDHGLSSGRRR
jgi:hypothetical protein